MSRQLNDAQPQGPVAILANALILAPRDALTARQRKVLLWAIAQIGRANAVPEFELEVARFARAADIRSESLHGELRKAVDGLQRATVYPGGQLYDRYGNRAAQGPVPWVTRVDFSRPGVLRFTLNPALARFLTNLTANFTQVRVLPALSLRSTYALAFFERLELHRLLQLKEWEMTTAELRQWLGVAPKQYAGAAYLRKSVVDRARLELASTTTHMFDYSIERCGRHEVIRFTARTLRRAVRPLRQTLSLSTSPIAIANNSTYLSLFTMTRLQTGTPLEELQKLISYAREFGQGVSPDWTNEQIRDSEEFVEWLQMLVRFEREEWRAVVGSMSRPPMLEWLETGIVRGIPDWAKQPRAPRRSPENPEEGSAETDVHGLGGQL